MANMGYPIQFPNVNEAGEPLISGEALRYEQYLDDDPSNWFCDAAWRVPLRRVRIRRGGLMITAAIVLAVWFVVAFSSRSSSDAQRSWATGWPRSHSPTCNSRNGKRSCDES